jgi:hypothetical protein
MTPVVYKDAIWSLYIPVVIFNKLWNATIAEILTVGRETLNTNKTRSVRYECFQSKFSYAYPLIFIVRIFLWNCWAVFLFNTEILLIV